VYVAVGWVGGLGKLHPVTHSEWVCTLGCRVWLGMGNLILMTFPIMMSQIIESALVQGLWQRHRNNGPGCNGHDVERHRSPSGI